MAGTFDDPRFEAFGMLIETHNEVLAAVTRGLEASANVPVPWLGVLIRLARSPDSQLRMSVLASDMTMSNSGLTRLVDRIEAAGHVERRSCPEDRRGMHAVLTPAGRAVVEAAAPEHLADLQTTMADALSPAELTGLTDLLRRVRDHVRALDGR